MNAISKAGKLTDYLQLFARFPTHRYTSLSKLEQAQRTRLSYNLQHSHSVSVENEFDYSQMSVLFTILQQLMHEWFYLVTFSLLKCLLPVVRACLHYFLPSLVLWNMSYFPYIVTRYISPREHVPDVLKCQVYQCYTNHINRFTRLPKRVNILETKQNAFVRRRDKTMYYWYWCYIYSS